MNSSLFSINWNDAWKALLLAVLTAFVGQLVAWLQSIVPILSGGQFPTLPSLADIGSWLAIGLSVGLSYLLKNFLTNSENRLLGKESVGKSE